MRSKHENKHIIRLVYCALLAALTCVSTIVIRVPSVGGVGYVNLGDTVVLICAWLLGGIYGGFAAGVGTAFADLLSGYTYYSFGSLVIKFSMAFVASHIYRYANKRINKELISLLLSGFVAEIIMIIGYFLYKAFILGKGYLAAVPSVFSNILQGIICIVTGILLYLALKKSRFILIFQNNLENDDKE